MIKPTIHLNGTSRQDLDMEYRNAYDAVDKAIEALCKVTVHGRDYYPQGNDVTYEAMKEHNERIAKLQSVRADLAEIVLSLIKF